MSSDEIMVDETLRRNTEIEVREFIQKHSRICRPIIPTVTKEDWSTMRLYGEMMLPKLPPLPIRYLSDIIMQKLEAEENQKRT